MSPVSTTNNPTTGYTGNLGSGLGFDPIAARNPDRPKFRLDEYKEVNEPRETTPSRTTSNRSDRGHKTEDAPDQRQSDNVAQKPTDATGRAGASTTQDKADTKQSQENVQSGTADASAAEAKSGKSNGASAADADAETKPVKDQPADTSAPYFENAEAAIGENAEAAIGENTEGTADASHSTEIAAAVSSAQTESSASEVTATSVPEQKVAAEKVAAIPTPTSKDPKLAALEKLTQIGQSAAATTQSAVSGDDTTTFKLPVPWPPQAQSEAAQGNKGAVGQTTAATQKAVNQSQAATAQTISVPNDAEESRSAEGSKQATSPTATKTAGETNPKIEIVSQAAKPAAAADTVVITNSRTTSTEGSVKQTALPTPSETIAAATALNSRPVQSNALGGSNSKRSNAVTASNENNGNGAKAAASQGQPNPAIVSQTSQTNPAAAAVTAATQGQAAATMPEQLASVRRQSSSTQRAQADPTNTTSNTSRAADLPAQGTSNGFADTLRTASVDRMTAPQDRQTLPTPATEQVKVKLVKAAQGGLDKIKIQLNPSELGKVEVRLEIGSDGAIRGTVIADKPETMDLLQRDAKQLERALQDAGFKTGGDSLDFQMRGDGANERDQRNTGNGPLSNNGDDQNGGDELPTTDTTGTEHDGIGDDGSLNLVA